MKGTLVLVRHGESQWNAAHLWTGLTDIGLTPKGKEEAGSAAKLISDIVFDRAFTSKLTRASDTLRIILDQLHTSCVVVSDAALNERDYGIFTGKNKLEIQSTLGDEEFYMLRRGWDYPIEHGESLKQVFGRVIPYYKKEIAPLLQKGNNIIVVSHGNSLRALMKFLENVSDEDISGVELATGEVIVYQVNEEGTVISKEKRHQEPTSG